MKATIVGVQGHLAGRRIPVAKRPVTFGRGDENDIVLTDAAASRLHAELREEAGGFVLYDRGSSNGTWVNGISVTARPLQSGDLITIGDEVFRFEAADLRPTVETRTIAIPAGPAQLGHPEQPQPQQAEPQPVPAQPVLAKQAPAQRAPARQTQGPALRVTITGGGPVGLSFALLLADLMGSRVAITMYEGRWKRDGGKIVWKGPDEGNIRRMQVVTIQSRQYLKLPLDVQEYLFTPGAYTEMWPKGPDSIQDLGPRNIRIAYVEDQLLALANEKTDQIKLIPEVFDAEAGRDKLAGQHVLAICEGGRSRTLSHFATKFGVADTSMYAMDGEQLQDMVLGLRVKSDLPDPMSVLLTVTQNRFLLNSLRGEGFLNMRLTSQETKEAVGIDPIRQVFTECLQAGPCLMERRAAGDFQCGMHNALFLPALLKGSAFWTRVEEGLELFGVRPENLTAVTAFKLDMVQRPRFSAQLFPSLAGQPGTFGFLLGDAANAIHFWPGRGLNSGLASAISLARCLAAQQRPTSAREADFVRHEAVMAMLQYRHKSRAWRQMVTADADGSLIAIKDLIARGIAEGEQGGVDQAADFTALMQRLTQTRGRLAERIGPMPDDVTLQTHMERLPASLVHTLLISEPWDSGSVGGEEVDLEILFDAPRPQRADRPAAAGTVAVGT